MAMLSRRTLLAASAVLSSGLAGRASAQDDPVRWQGPVELARGKGVRGAWQQNDSRYDFVDDPAVAFTRDGSLVVAWVDQARKAVLVQRRHPDGSAAADPVEVARQPQTFSWMPRLALLPDASGTVLVLWQEIIFSGGSHGGEMFLARSTDGGRSFGPPRNLSGSVGGDGKGRITPDHWHNGSYDLLALPGGRVAAAWTEYDGLLWLATSADGGRTFARPRRLAGGDGGPPVRAPTLAGSQAMLWLAWTHGDQPAADIHVARSADGGVRFDAATVLRTPGYSDAPRLGVDTAGALHLAWAESQAGPFTPQRVLYARSRDAGRSFEAPREIGRPGAGFVSAGFPTLALDERGRVLVLAELQQDLRQRPRALGLAVSRDGGERFLPLRVVPGSSDAGGGFNGSSQGLLIPKLALGSGGEVAVVNSALLEGSHSRVWLLRGQLR